LINIIQGNPGKIGFASAVDVALDGGSVADIFTIAGGPVMLVALIGVCTEAVSANACNLRLEADPSDIVTNTNICANVDINAMAVGSIMFVTGVEGAAMVIAVPGTALPRGMSSFDGTVRSNMVLHVGTVDLTLANSDPTSGIATFYLAYLPLTPGATVSGS
jgi:hypothetical protein